ncbi:MAG: polysaccharide deacetylase family protein [Actinomycetota bacterium]
MNRRFRSLFGLQALVALVAFAFPLVVATELHDSPPPIEIFIRMHPHFVDPGTTFGEVVDTFAVHARSGDLLDVEGKVLQPHAFPGQVLLNGRRVPHSKRLVDRDRIWVVSESDRREMVTRRVVHLRGRRPTDPQFYLGAAPGRQVVTTGKISGKLVSSVFEPTGPTHTPKAVALTFDDGPNSVYTPRILSILHRMHVHATFFTIGYLVERYPEVVRREKRAGMVVANHTWNHPNSPAFRTLGARRIEREMLDANIALGDLDVEPHLFRPPGGSSSDDVVQIARSLGMRVVLWSIDPEDWRAGVTAPQIVANVLSNARRGSIVILHDGGGDQSATVRALPLIIRGLRKRHLGILAVR